MCERQAEITGDIAFKAGQEFAEKAIQNQLLGIIEASKKVGIKEAVEWVKSVTAYDKDGKPFICAHCGTCVVIPIWLWEDKLKELEL